jgi:DNA polymerase-3 subunit gamma/tau
VPEPFSEPSEETAQVIAAFGPNSFEMALEMLEEAREIVLVTELERFVRLVEFKPGALVVELLPNAPPDLQERTAKALRALTQTQWRVELGKGGRESIVERAKRLEQERLDAATAAPEIQAALEAFPGARIVEVRPAPAPIAIQRQTSPIDPDAVDGEEDGVGMGPDNVLSVDFTRKRAGD